MIALRLSKMSGVESKVVLKDLLQLVLLMTMSVFVPTCTPLSIAPVSTGVAMGEVSPKSTIPDGKVSELGMGSAPGRRSRLMGKELAAADAGQHKMTRLLPRARSDSVQAFSPLVQVKAAAAGTGKIESCVRLRGYYIHLELPPSTVATTL